MNHTLGTLTRSRTLWSLADIFVDSTTVAAVTLTDAEVEVYGDSIPVF